MRWRGRRQSSNIEDLRGHSGAGGLGRGGGFSLPGGFGRGSGVNLPGGYGRGPMVRRAGGGISIGLIIIALILFLVFGIDPSAILGGL